MKNWIYLKSCRINDIFSLSVALDVAKDQWNVVRTMAISQYLMHHPKVTEIGFPKPGDNVIHVNPEIHSSFKDKVNHILTAINEEEAEILPETEVHVNLKHQSIIDRINQGKYILVILNENKREPVNLFFIDEFCHLMRDKGFEIASAGDLSIPCIRGTTDLSGLLKGAELLAATKHASLIISNRQDLIEYCRITKAAAFYIQQDNAIISCNNIELMTPNHLVNLILKQYRDE